MTDQILSNRLAFWIDRGGTFTDVIARLPNGSLAARKYLSEDPARYQDAASFAIAEILAEHECGTSAIDAIKMGTTVATNALLEHKGDRTALIITGGLRDTILIGQQHRPDLFALNPRRAVPLYENVWEVPERLAADGSVITPLEHTVLKSALAEIKSEGITSVAIVFAHAYLNPVHEKEAASLADDFGFNRVVTSSGVSPLIKMVPRGDTALVDAYLSPILGRYIDLVRQGVGNAPLYFMQSHGGLAAADHFTGKDAILSGPAGGIVGATKIANEEGIDNLITFDMGGTSTDVAYMAGDLARTSNSEIAGVRISVPMMDIHTVAAGGGSVCQYKAGRFLVGPESAGANPGPACYGRGGPLAITDCNLILGRIDPSRFPAIFGEQGDQPLDKAAALAAMERVLGDVRSEDGPTLSPEEAAEGFIRVGIDHMARAIKRVSVARGQDAGKAALLTFGGAGGQHSALVADALKMTKVVIPPYAGLLSALGMGLADLRVIKEATVTTPIALEDQWHAKLEGLQAEARKTLLAEGIGEAEQTCLSTAHLKEAGSDTTLAVTVSAISDMAKAFAKQFTQSFGFEANTSNLIIDRLTVEVSGGGMPVHLSAAITPAEAHEASIFINGGHVRVTALERNSLEPGKVYQGPMMVFESGSTSLVPPGWNATRSPSDSLILTRQDDMEQSNHPQHALPDTIDPIQLEVFNNRFMAIAEEMGSVLARTAHSVNIKERLDFSCALFDAKGGLIANAPHMPVHLGSMGDSVLACLNSGKPLGRGDILMVNNPFAGGTHLPDITLVAPVFLDGSTLPDFFVASRGHHADIGGVTPGSMPPNSKSLSQEGIVFSAFPLVKAGVFQQESVFDALLSGPHPARSPDQNIADLKAQAAALARGSSLLVSLVGDYGAPYVKRYMGFIQDNAEAAVRRLLTRLKSGKTTYPLDNGAIIAIDIDVAEDGTSATIDFTGTSMALADNYNAPFSVTKAAVLYVFRTLTGEDIPLNAGCLKPLNLIVPEGSILNPPKGAAVVAGNVETSQAVVNALFLATGTLSAGQGTMNNLIFGNDRYQYYETLAGGMGASHDADGADALHSHMTNSRLTDIEVLEQRYPVRVTELRVRANSGGTGKNKGGNGLIREIEFYDEMTVSILSLMRDIAPPGLKGAKDGGKGQNWHIPQSGEPTPLPYRAELVVNKGDRIRIETPGGGGFGAP